MKLRICSDLHLEQFLSKPISWLSSEMIPPDERDSDSVLVLAGDISSKKDQLLNFLQEVGSRFKHVIYVAGNHEWYYQDFLTYPQELEEGVKALANVSCSFNGVRVKEIEDVRFIFCTLWADGGGSPLSEIRVGQGLNDFYVIKMGQGPRFSVQDMKRLHSVQKDGILLALRMPFPGKTVVVTHHLPSYSLCHPRFGSDINGGFASACDDILFSKEAPDVWIHGHTHDTIEQLMGNGTLVICNPRGYIREFNGSTYNSYSPKFLDV